MIRFCLIRHGQTDWNIEGRYQGQSDVPLNENGRRQARQVAEEIRGEHIDMIITSNLQRARETAEIIASVIQVPIQEDVRLREINQGEWEGKRPDQIKLQYFLYHLGLLIRPKEMRIPGGETINEVAERMSACLNDQVALSSGKKVILVSHGLALATMICKSKGIPIQKAFMHIPKNGHPYWLEWQ